MCYRGGSLKAWLIGGVGGSMKGGDLPLLAFVPTNRTIDQRFLTVKGRKKIHNSGLQEKGHLCIDCRTTEQDCAFISL